MEPKDIESLADELAALDINNDTGFRRLLNDTLSIINVAPELAREVGVGRPTIGRWIRGDSVPHPAVRRFIISYLEKKVRSHASIMRGLADSAAGRTTDLGNFSKHIEDDE